MSIQLLVKVSILRNLVKVEKKRLLITAFDESGSVQLVWFKGIKWIKTLIKEGDQYIIFGKPNLYDGKINFNHPEIELAEKNKNKVGTYNLFITQLKNYHLLDFILKELNI